MMHDQALKAKWVAALRSGDYKQTKCSLRWDGAYCCLGVLNDIRGVDQRYWDLAMIIGTDWTPLARMNDEDEKSFPEIADYIEETL